MEETYKVYNHQTGGYRAVKQDFSWTAFFFTWIWAFGKNLWLLGAMGLIVWTVLVSLAEDCAERGNDGALLIVILLKLTYLVFFGKFGNRWYINSLEKRGFEYIDTVTAEDPETAMIQVANWNKEGEKGESD